jgi:hypothetical protein
MGMVNWADIKETLDRIEGEILEVKRQYDLFFQGGRRSEPSEKRREVEEAIRRIGQRKIINTNDQFRFNSLQNRFYSLSNLWQRMVRDMEEAPQKKDPTRSRRSADIPVPDPVDPAHIESVMEQFSAARRTCGLSVEETDLDALRKTLLSRARELSLKAGGKSVEFRVSVEDGKPKLTALIR